MSVTIETIKNVLENSKSVQDFLAMDEGSNAWIEQESALRAIGITLDRQDLKELMLVFGNQGAVQRFLDLRDDTEYCEKQAAILSDLGIAPDRQYLTNVTAALRTELSIIDKAKRYVALDKLKGSGAELSSEAADEVASLRRQLSARGLDPQHVVELEYRALVFAHKADVQIFVGMRDSDKGRAAAIAKLKKLGINPNKKHLVRVLVEFGLFEKQTSKKKTARGIDMARKLSDLDLAKLNAKMAAEDAEIASAAAAFCDSVEELEEIAGRCGLTPLEFATSINEFSAAERCTA